MPEFDLDRALQRDGCTRCQVCDTFVVADDEAHDGNGETCTGFTSWEQALPGGEEMHMPVAIHKCPGCQARVYVCYKPVSSTLMVGREAEMDHPEETTAHYLQLAAKPECTDCGECNDISMSYPVEEQESMVSRYECNNCGCFWDVTWEVDHEHKA